MIGVCRRQFIKEKGLSRQLCWWLKDDQIIEFETWVRPNKTSHRQDLNLSHIDTTFPTRNHGPSKVRTETETHKIFDSRDS